MSCVLHGDEDAYLEDTLKCAHRLRPHLRDGMDLSQSVWITISTLDDDLQESPGPGTADPGDDVAVTSFIGSLLANYAASHTDGGWPTTNPSVGIYCVRSSLALSSRISSRALTR